MHIIAIVLVGLSDMTGAGIRLSSYTNNTACLQNTDNSYPFVSSAQPIQKCNAFMCPHENMDVILNTL